MVDLARRRHGKLLDHKDPVGQHVVGEVRTRAVKERRGRHIFCRLDERRDPESALDLDGNTGHARDTVDSAHHPADLGERDPNAAPLDHIVGATHIDVVTLLVSTDQVPGLVHELPGNDVGAQDLLGERLIIPVALHELVSGDMELADVVRVLDQPAA